MEKSLLAYIFLVIIIFLLCRSNDSVRLKFTNANCASLNESWVRINQCRLKAISRNKTVFNFNATLLHPTTNLWTHYRMFKRASGYKPWLFNHHRADCCRFLRKPYNAFGIFIFNMFKDYLNIKTCPLSGDILVQGMYLRAEMFNLPMPTGDFLFSSMWSFHNKSQFEVNVSFVFDEDLI